MNRIIPLLAIGAVCAGALLSFSGCASTATSTYSKANADGTVSQCRKVTTKTQSQSSASGTSQWSSTEHSNERCVAPAT